MNGPAGSIERRKKVLVEALRIGIATSGAWDVAFPEARAKDIDPRIDEQFVQALERLVSHWVEVTVPVTAAMVYEELLEQCDNEVYARRIGLSEDEQKVWVQVMAGVRAEYFYEAVEGGRWWVRLLRNMDGEFMSQWVVLRFRGYTVSDAKSADQVASDILNDSLFFDPAPVEAE